MVDALFPNTAEGYAVDVHVGVVKKSERLSGCSKSVIGLDWNACLSFVCT